jgi:hypothetical protein
VSGKTIRLLLMCVAAGGMVVVLALPPVGCQGRPKGGLRTVPMQIGRKSFSLEVADTPGAREYGLMQRDSLAWNRGMIFVFEEEREQSFWMKNTRIPLDILFIDAGGRVVSIRQMRPYDLRSTPSDGRAKYAIELNQGAAADAGVKEGDQVAVPAEAREAADQGKSEK